MPFTETEVLNETPDVNIFFSGLLVMEPVGNDACQIFVNASAPRHHLTIEVRRKRQGRPDDLLMRHIGPLAFVSRDQAGEVPLHGMIIRKVDGQNAVKAFAPTNPPPDGTSRAFNLAIDMARADLHGQNRELEPATASQPPKRLLDVDPLGGRPSILLEDGVLYTAAKHEPHPEFKVMLKKPDGSEKEMPPFARLIGAAITLEEGSHVVILWRQQGKLERLQLMKLPGVTYEIYIVNDPLFESDAIADVVRNPRHDEFAEYYKILHRVPTNEQFRLRIKQPDPNTPPPPLDRGSTRLPCMPVVVGGGGD